MSSNKLLIIVIIVVNVGVKSDQMTFKNVSLHTPWPGQFAIILESNYLKNHIPIERNYSRIFVRGIIPVLRKDSVSDIKNVRSLGFIGVNMEKIEVGAFKNLDGVNELDISHNNLTILVNGTFENLTIQILDLTYNYIKHISKEAFKNLPKLTDLLLFHNKIEILEDGIFDNLHALNNLRLDYNEISSLPDEYFKSLPTLKTIILNHNHLKSISKDVFKNHPNLDWIEITHNQITFIDPEAFDNMPKLTGLRLEYNKLTKIDPLWFKNSPNLYYIQLNGNRIGEIPDEAFRNINNGKNEIYLGRNLIERVSRNAFKGLQNIVVLNLDLNGIDYWNGNFLKDVNIGTLDLNNNRILCPEGDFDQVFKAEFTHLNYNHLTNTCLEEIDNWKKNHSDKFISTLTYLQIG